MSGSDKRERVGALDVFHENKALARGVFAAAMAVCLFVGFFAITGTMTSLQGLTEKRLVAMAETVDDDASDASTNAGTGAQQGGSDEVDAVTSNYSAALGAESDTQDADVDSDAKAEDTAAASQAKPPVSRGDVEVSDNVRNMKQQARADVYRILSGDTLCAISNMFGVSVDALAKANAIQDVNLIYADSSIVIPDATGLPSMSE